MRSPANPSGPDDEKGTEPTPPEPPPPEGLLFASTSTAEQGGNRKRPVLPVFGPFPAFSGET